MVTQWGPWLAAEKAASRTGIVFSQKPIVRGQAYELVLPIPADVSADAFDAAFYAGVDADLSPLAAFAVVVGDFDSEAGTTDVTLSLAATDTDDEPTDDADFDGLAEVVFKMNYTPSGGSATRCLSLVIPIVE